MKDKLRIKGVWTFDGYENGVFVGRYKKENIIVQGFYDLLWQFLREDVDGPAVSDLNLTHMATGDGTTPAAIADTLLENELFRKSIASRTYTDDTFTCKLSLATSESNFDIREVGIFADGTGTVDTGTLISHASVNIPKNSNIQYLVTYNLMRV
jgi:hypothetical protein